MIDTGTERIAFFSGHLHPFSADIRAREATVMLSVMQKENRQGRFGAVSGRPESLSHRGPNTSGGPAQACSTPLPSTGGPQQPTVNSLAPKIRLDYIWVSGPLAKRLQAARVLNEGAFRTNPVDPASFALSDHLPVTAKFA